MRRQFHLHPVPHHYSGDRLAGFTLLEMMLALSVLSISLLGFGAFFVLNARSADDVTENALVIQSFRELAERIRGGPFRDIAATYQGFPVTIPKINATGTVTVFLNETDSSADAAMLGLPRDLDGDGLATNVNILADYLLLPVKIEFSWTGAQGPRQESMYFLLAQENN